MPKVHDIAILGATAAGYVAAAMLAEQGRDVIVVDASDDDSRRAGAAAPTESPLVDWIPADVFETCRFLREIGSSAAVRPFRAVRVHSAGLDRQSEYRSRATLGFILRSERFLKCLETAARRAGADFARIEHPAALDLRENGIVVRQKTASAKTRRESSRQVHASMLIIAAGSPSEAVASLAVPAGNVSDGRMTVCGLDVPLSASLHGRDDEALHVVALAGEAGFGMFFRCEDLLHVRIIIIRQSPGVSADASEIVRFVRDLQRADLLGGEPDLSKARAALWHPPAGVALEMEMHIAKRALLIGTAGGFASAMTGQTLDPAIRSAAAAADVAGRALDSDRFQETLGQYKDQWRSAISRRIRPATTPLRMLLPMVLTNKAMTARFAKAFLHGENI